MLIIGHRGARGEAPENTLAGFKYLLDAGIKDVELDIRFAKDGQLVVIHDNTVNRTTAATGLVADFTGQELAHLPGRHEFTHRWSPEQSSIPSLADVVNASSDMNSYQFEVKADDDIEAYGLAEAVVAFVEEAKLWDKVIITSINQSVLVRVNEITQGQNIKTGYVSGETWPEPLVTANELNTSHLILHYKKATPERVSQAKQAGKIVSVWTVNRWQEFAFMCECNVDSIITDYPHKMSQRLTARSP